MRLQQVILNRFCGFKSFRLDLGDLTVLVGPNNGGKTTILRAISFVLDAVREHVSDRPQPNLNVFGRESVAGASVSQRFALSEETLLRFRRVRDEQGGVVLVFDWQGTTLMIEARFDGRTNMVMHGSVDGKPIQEAVTRVGPRNTDSLLAELVRLRAEFIPPVGDLQPSEQIMDWQTFQQQGRQGRVAQTWRNRLHWMSEGQDPNRFLSVIDRVRRCMPGVQLEVPRRSRRARHVDVVYLEDGVEYDISAAGAGLRTLVTLAATLELADASILLFDEPDAHLHSALQRQVARLLEDAANDKQIVAASHAPDFIDELPTESLAWIDKSQEEARPIGDVGKTLVDLGAISTCRALQWVDGDTLIYCEGSLDRRVLKELIERSDKACLAGRAVFEKLGGFGDVSKLPGALSVLRSVLRTRIALAAIRDSDYAETTPEGRTEVEGGVLVIWLPCKELENLIIMSPETIVQAAQESARRRTEYTRETVDTPSAEQLSEKIDEFTEADDVIETLKPQWMCRWASTKNVDLNDPGQLKEAEAQFQKHVASAQWRRRCCPGKKVLKCVKRWLQEQYKVSVTDRQLFASYEPTEELRRLFDALEKHVDATLS